MFKISYYLACTVFTTAAFANPGNESPASSYSISSIPSFTGKISKNKVRMRNGPTLDAPIIKELNRGDLLVITGETEEFFAVQAPSDLKGYIFRTFVLDNKIEGNHVNVRLSPNTDAPVIAQLNSGDVVNGVISPINNKWYEIPPPASTRFFVAKEYVEKVGDQNYMARMNKRRDEVNQLLQSTYAQSQDEMKKAFPEIQLNRLTTNYQKIIKDYTDFPEQSSRAKELLEQLENDYLHKKLAYLENKANQSQGPTTIIQKSANPLLEPANFPTNPLPPTNATTRMQQWEPYEEAIYQQWSQNNSGTKDEFYSDQRQSSVTLTGELQPYGRPVKNKPGDYVLLSRATQQPIGFLYSTVVDLEGKVGQEVNVEVVERPNNYFAYPAYFVLSIQ